MTQINHVRDYLSKKATWKEIKQPTVQNNERQIQQCQTGMLSGNTLRFPLWNECTQTSTINQSDTSMAEAVASTSGLLNIMSVETVWRLLILLRKDGRCVCQLCNTFAVLGHKRHAGYVRSLSRLHSCRHDCSGNNDVTLIKFCCSCCVLSASRSSGRCALPTSQMSRDPSRCDIHSDSVCRSRLQTAVLSQQLRLADHVPWSRSIVKPG